MAKTPKPKGLPLSVELGPAIGNGQDNAVYTLLKPAAKPHLREAVGVVAKVNHDLDGNVNSKRIRDSDPREAARAGIRYKKNKYDILKHFLGDFIPNSMFVLTQARASQKDRFVELTLQEELPQFRLDQLTPEQKEDPRLKDNLSGLLGKMQYMYGVLGEANARSAQGSHLDAKLDLGGVSDMVRAERLDHVFSDDEISNILHTNKSPNILVNPDSMQLFCIDFDQGQWNDGMSDTKNLAFEIDARNRRRQTQKVGAYPLHQTIMPPVESGPFSHSS